MADTENSIELLFFDTFSHDINEVINTCVLTDHIAIGRIFSTKMWATTYIFLDIF